jgi:hypothetical protein
MFEIKFNVDDFIRKTLELNAAIDQIPFALSLALNQAAMNARKVLVQDTWPRSVNVKNPGFIGRALRTKFSTKNNLVVEVFDDLGKASLQLHALGGTKRPKSSRELAIPIKGRVSYTQRGVRSADRPRNLKNSFLIPGKGIFKRERGGGISMVYALKPTAQIKPDVDFYGTWTEVMRNELRTSFPAAMARAMKGRR